MYFVPTLGQIKWTHCIVTDYIGEIFVVNKEHTYLRLGRREELSSKRRFTSLNRVPLCSYAFVGVGANIHLQHHAGW